jgi:predicted short-subunit dehydrogenase-like oxidoreductase (DUF2520 family)
MGGALSLAFTRAGLAVEGPLGRDELARASGADLVLLCVPDAEIRAAGLELRRRIAADPARLVGHCSGATGLEELAPLVDFSLHPLMTVAGDALRDAERLRGATAAVAGTSDRSLAAACTLARAAGMDPVEVADADRAAYHVAATVASNFLVALEGAAETLALHAGITREQLVPLVRATAENWAAVGARDALTGPIARGDETTVARQRAAIADVAPELLELFDALCELTRGLVRGPEVPAQAGVAEAQAGVAEVTPASGVAA